MAALYKQACAAMARYYKSQGAPYNNQFSDFCEESGFEDDESLLEEIADTTAADCILVEFDENFPHEDDLDDEAKAEFIFTLIKQCVDDPSIGFGTNVPDFNQFGDAFAKIKDRDLERMRKTYKEQCPALWNASWAVDEGFLTMLAVGRNEGFDYLLNLFDDYNRWRVKMRDTKHLKGTTREWCEKHPHFAQMENVTMNAKKHEGAKKFKEIAVSAVNSFGNRICNKLTLKPLKRIDDSLERVATYIQNAVNFVSSLAIMSSKEEKTICPFQVDFCIAIGKEAIDDEKKETTEDDPDDDDDDDADDEDDQKFVDKVGDIKAKLKANKLKYATFESSAIDKNRLQEFYTGFMNENNLKGSGKSQYLHEKRLIMMIDRRISRDDISKPDSIWIYESPADCGKISGATVPEWYINSSVKCVLPTDDPKGKGVGTKDHCKGSLLTFSFHVKQERVIKCYLYWNGQMMRFMADDIKDVLPMLFSETDNKIQGGLEEKINSIIADIKPKLVDEEFSAFVASYKKCK